MMEILTGQSQNYLVEKIDKLCEVLQKIFNQKSTELSFVDGYSDCYQIVLNNKGPCLYDVTKESIIKYLSERVKPIVEEDLQCNRLQGINKNWETVDVCVKRFRDLLMFLDSNYAERERLPTIYEMGIENFRSLILEDSNVANSVTSVLCGIIISERDGEHIDHASIKASIDILLKIGDHLNKFSTYERVFESTFLDQTKTYYQQEAQKLMTNNHGFLYIKTYKHRVAQEKERISRYLHPHSEERLLNILETVMIKDHLNEMINLDYGFNWMVQNEQVTELKTIYEWIQKFTDEKNFKEIIKNSFAINAGSLGKDQDNAKMIEELINLKQKYCRLANECFDKNPSYENYINDNFILALNANPNNPKNMALYIHSQLREFNKNETETQIQSAVDNFIALFKILQDKDIFEKYYRQLLAKRLLSRRANVDVENLIISKLQMECGNQFIAGLKSMTNDIVISETHIQIFKDEMKDQGQTNFGVDLNTYVLASGVWPSFAQFPLINLPDALCNIYNIFTVFYLDKHSGRKVTLQCNMGTAHIQANYTAFKNSKNKLIKDRCYSLECTTLQAIVIMLFNDTTKLTFNEVQAKTNIPELVLESILKALCNSKILNSNEISDTKIIQYIVNIQFTSKNRRFKILNPIATKEEEYKRIDESMAHERHNELEALIVRIMKTHKSLQEANLHMEVIKLARKRFLPNIEMIITAIKSLIDREYIKSHENDSKLFVYME